MQQTASAIYVNPLYLTMILLKISMKKMAIVISEGEEFNKDLIKKHNAYNEIAVLSMCFCKF